MNSIIRDDIVIILKKVNLENLRKKKVLITGSNGLIGTYLISTIYAANQQLGLEAEVIGVSKSKPNSTLQEFQGDPKFFFYSSNLAESKLNYDEVDYVIHGATYAQPKKFLENKLETIKLNTEVTEKLLRFCVECNASFLFLSSAEIYGQPPKEFIPTSEAFSGSCPTTSPRAAYGEAKRIGEAICSIFRQESGVDVRIARISAVYGPGVSIYDQRVLGHFLKNALVKKHIELLDDGKQVRTWCYITDCVAMLLNILLCGRHFIYNVGGRDTVSIKGLAEIICELTQSTYSLGSQKKQADFIDQPPDWVELDIQRVSSEFDLGEFTGLRKGLENTIRWNRDTVLPELLKKEGA